MTPAQNKALLDFEAISGFEFMHKDEVADGTMTFKEAWKANINWLVDMTTECRHIKYPYDDDLEEDE